MGSEDFYPEEGPIRHVEVDGFWMDRHPVTVADFQRFVDATSYVTLAERLPDPAAYPDADPDLLVPGALVFHATSGPVDLDDYRNWWSYQPGASWHTPEGPGSTVQGRDSHPVTQVAFEDAQAYATWTGKQLPTEAEWEFAARGGLESKVFAWGDTFAPNGRMMANTWQGEFPWQNMLLDRFERTSPVDVFPPNGFGLFDMTGNVWEWTSDSFTLAAAPDHGCCAPRISLVGDPREGEAIPSNVVKGGSHLCAPNYCLRYRPAARSAEAIDTSTGHIGFRCVIRPRSQPT